MAKTEGALSEEIDRVAWAINAAWNEFGDVPFPLYQHEAEALAKAAIEAMPKAPAIPEWRAR